MDIETVTVRLGETDYTVRAAPYARSKKWRARLLDEVKPLFDQITSAQGMTFENPEDLLALWPLISSLLLDGIDTVFEMLIAYSQELEDNREAIEESASEKQIMAAFQEVLRIADPFGLSQRLASMTGQAMNGTPPRSHLPSGDSIEVRQAD